MRYLTTEHWQTFLRGDRRDGVRFEDLIESLLPALYGGPWQRTKASWDRNRDFWKWDGKKKYCAECKNLSENISLKIISPTLVMAIIDGFDAIVFFSYSPLNQNALRHLAQFQQRTSKLVELFHDESLEQIIIRNAEVISRYFPGYNGPTRADRSTLTVRFHVSRDPDVEYWREDPEGVASHQEKLPAMLTLDTFCLDLFIINNDTNESANALATLHQNEFGAHFALLNSEVAKTGSFSISIGRAGIYTKRLYFKSLRPGRDIQLPRIRVQSVGARSIFDQHIDTGRVDIASILRTPLIGKSFHEAINRFGRIISLRNKPVVFTIEGPSGAGKSRLLYELRDKVFSREYSLYSFKGENQVNSSFDEFIRKFIAKRYRLPQRLTDEPEIAPPQPDTDSRRSRLIQRILYSPGYIPSQNREECFALFLESLEGQSTALILDDVQSFDQASGLFLNDLVTALVDMPGRMVLLLSFNTDLTDPLSSCGSFLNRLRDLNATQSDQCSVIRIEGFSPADTLTYLDHCLSASQSGSGSQTRFSREYRETASLFMDNVQHRPLFIEQTLLYMENEGAIQRLQERLYVRDIEKFHLLLRTLPKTIEGLIKRRWHFVEQILPEADEVIFFVTWLVHFPRGYAARLGIGYQTLGRLVELGFLRITEAGDICFYHQTFLRFFKSFIDLYSPSFTPKLAALLDEPAFQREYYLQFFVLAEASANLKSSDIGVATRVINKGLVQNEYLVEFIQSFMRSFDVDGDETNGGTLIMALDTLADRLREEVSFSECLAAYEEVFARYLRNWTNYTDFGEDYFSFILRYAAICLTTRNDHKALDLLEWASDVLDSFLFSSEAEKMRFLCLVGNRLCVSLRSMSRRGEALKTGRRALQLAQKHGLRYLEVQNHVDLGYIYYGRLQDRTSLIREWKTAVELFTPDCLPRDPVVTGANVVRYHRAHVAILEGRLGDAELVIDRYTPLFARQLDIFHEVKALILKVVVRLIDPSKRVDFGELDSILQRVLDRCVRYGAGQSYWVAYHAQAKVAERRGDQEGAAVSFRNAYHQLVRIIRNDAMEKRFADFFEDFAIALRRADAQLSPEEFASVRSDRLRLRVERICDMSERQFLSFLRMHRPKTIYHDGQFSLPCP